MKVLFSALLAFVLCASAASAELLVTANPIGQGKWAVLGSGMLDSNAGNNSSAGLSTVGGYVGYGATSKLDVFLNAGQANVTGITGYISTTNVIGLSGKYQIMDEASAPVSVAIGAGYRSMNNVQSSTNGNQLFVGVGVSKMMAPFVPYGGVTYRSNTEGGSADGSQIDLTIGSAIAWSAQGAVFVEDTYQMFSSVPSTGSYNSNQVALGVGYKI
jgi:hypothetical protein